MSDPLTPNMSLIQPIPGIDSGISAANSYNANFTTLDQHNHSVGSGVQITPSGLNINASLPFNANAATGLGYVQITTQGIGIPTPVNYSVYFSGLEFFVKDGAGNSVQLTTGGNVNATSSGIASGTASASFISSVLVVNAATNKPANIQGGSILLGNNVTGTNYLTLSPPNAMPASYGLVLPSLPASTQFLTMDTSGNMGTAASVPNNQITALTTTNLSASAGILKSQLAAASTGTTVGSGGVAISATSSGYTTTSASFANVTGQTVTLTTNGGPIRIVTGSFPTGGGADVLLTSTTATNNQIQAFVQLLRGGSPVCSQTLFLAIVTTTSTLSISVPANFLEFIDPQAAGTYTYQLQARVASTNYQLQMLNMCLIAYEL